MARIKPAPTPVGQVRSLAPLAALLLLPVLACTTDIGRCQATGNGGAVVVRWRVVDNPSGRLFPRGQCCCAPTDVSGAARDECLGVGGALGSQCPDSPGWLVRSVKLRIRRLGESGVVIDNRGADAALAIPDGGAVDDYSIDAECTGAELTTAFCLPPGAYELSLTATAERLSGGAWGPAATSQEARVVTPAAVRRNVQPGQIVNLDVVVLGVNGAQAP